MRVIHLTHGAGNGINKACLMTASNMLIGRGEDGDNNSCVCQLLQSFIIATNDAMPEELLGELYGPLIWEILGTRNDDPAVIQRRAYAFADWTVREVAPLALESAGMLTHARTLRELPEIVDIETALAADAYAAARAAADAAHAAAYAASARASAAHAAAAARASAADAAADAAHAAAYAAAYAASARASAAHAARIWHMCPDIIRRAASIGDRRPVETVITIDQLAKLLCRKELGC